MHTEKLHIMNINSVDENLIISIQGIEIVGVIFKFKKKQKSLSKTKNVLKNVLKRIAKKEMEINNFYLEKAFH